MQLFLTLEALFSGEQYTYDIPFTAQIMDNFTNGDFNYLRTSSFYLKKPIGKTLFKKITSSEYNFDLATLFRTLNQTSYAAVSAGSIFSLLSAPFILFS